MQLAVESLRHCETHLRHLDGWSSIELSDGLGKYLVRRKY